MKNAPSTAVAYKTKHHFGWHALCHTPFFLIKLILAKELTFLTNLSQQNSQFKPCRIVCRLKTALFNLHEPQTRFCFCHTEKRSTYSTTPFSATNGNTHLLKPLAADILQSSLSSAVFVRGSFSGDTSSMKTRILNTWVFGFFWKPHFLNMYVVFDTYHGLLGLIAGTLLIKVINFSWISQMV